MRTGVLWSEEEVSYVREMASEGTKAEEIAEKLGRSKRSVHSLMSKRNIRSSRKNFWSEDELEALVELWSSKTCTREQIAKYLGRSVSEVRGKIYNAKLTALDSSYRSGHSLTPWAAGTRTILAKTCPTCGLFLDASEFDSYGRKRKRYLLSCCKKCYANGKAHSEPRRNDKNFQKGKDAERIRQEISLKTARRKGEEFTSKDLEVISDLSRSDLQIAQELERTYFSIHSARVRFDLPRRYEKQKDKTQEVWSLVKTGETLREEEEFEKLGVPEEDWMWND